jgi:hypothetical protein
MLLRAIIIVSGTLIFHVAFSAAPSYSQSSEEIAADLAAAERGDPDAQFAAGWIYETGRGVPKNFAKSAAWYEKAAGNGSKPALASLGYLYQTGSGVPQNSAKAVELYKRASEAGDIGGQFYLGVAYLNGIGVERNLQSAAKWIHAAAEAGHQQSQLMLATMLQQGVGVSKNEFAARRWFDRASKGSDQEIASKARAIRQQIDDRVLFSGALRPQEWAVVAAIGFGLLAAMSADPPPGADYQPFEYKPPRWIVCRNVLQGRYLHRYCY